jgi:hypothetical protein
MLIRSTPYACFVMLHNGLTLELVYDRSLIGAAAEADSLDVTDGLDLPRSASCGVWLMGETVLTDVVAGQA